MSSYPRSDTTTRLFTWWERTDSRVRENCENNKKNCNEESGQNCPGFFMCNMHKNPCVKIRNRVKIT